MANVINSTTLADSIGDGLVIPAYDKKLKWQLRSKVLWRQFVDVHPVSPTNDSNVVHLKRHDYLPVGTPTPIDEIVAPDQVAAPETIDVPVTLYEYGKTMGRTKWLGDVAYVPVDEALARQISTHCADTLDELVRLVFRTGTNRITANGNDGIDATAANVNTIVSGHATAANNDLLNAKAVRTAVKRLRSRSVEPVMGELYAAVISNDTSADFQSLTGGVPWSAPHIYQDTSNLYNGTIGAFAGAFFIETPRASVNVGAGASGVDVQETLIFGREVVAEAVETEPHVGLSPMVDPMNRGKGIYWYGSLGHALYRNEAVERIEHGITIG